MPVKTHYLPCKKWDGEKTIIDGYSVWAYSGHVLLGEIKNKQQYVDTLYQARKVCRQMRERFNPKVAAEAKP